MKIFPSLLAAVLSATVLGAAELPAAFTNSLGMRLVPIAPGTFRMGETKPTPGSVFGQAAYLRRGDWDEHPVHEVVLTQPFLIGEEEVTSEQFRAFRADFRGAEEFAPHASGVSWDEAVAFCAWLSAKEGRIYRLPTEAEWEYVCRAGTDSWFSNGSDKPPPPGTANRWGVKNLHTGVAEWCHDWHGEYLPGKQIDPVGPAGGFARVVRGGGLDKLTPFYARAANRAGAPPNFPPRSVEAMAAMISPANSRDAAPAGSPPAGANTAPANLKSEMLYRNFVRSTPNHQGQHPIGFRVVCAPLPASKPTPAHTPFSNLGVAQGGPAASIGPTPARPWYRKRYLLPTPPENTPSEQLSAFRTLGLHRAFLRHQHSPGLEVAPNGDVLFVSFTAVSETDPDVALITTRLRFGADAWDPPDLFLDLPDIDDHAPMFWNDAGTLWFTWGANKLDSGFPFQWLTSRDHGATWSAVNFPLFTTAVGGYSAQPITNGFRDRTGRIHIASDAVGPESVLWQSDDNGATWRDPAGRSGGRHTAFVELRDGRLLGMGGKSSQIDLFMPRSISSDGGRTWTISKTPFCWLGSNQRPALIRLASGRLFFAGDVQNEKGSQPAGFTTRGAVAALSDDEGETWHIRILPGTQPHETPARAQQLGGGTLGYAVARQAPNGVIHLIATMTEPCLHFELNEAWILHGDEAIAGADDATLRRNPAARLRDQREWTERDAAGRIRLHYAGGIADDGRFLLHGRCSWYLPDGRVQREADYALGVLVGRETMRDQDGHLVWVREHGGSATATTTFTTYWPEGTMRTRSTWRDLHAEGPAVLLAPDGREVLRAEFARGRVRSITGDPEEF
ncbi:MAG: SUMF1/EgtB/PvdO family nonheme iron enzyme [Verrucomicrobia bacterium]|nr:SUMF1/EgtB/PvdO family nonheme iron enzyme [Verrucomicrobiota bacterium]